MERRVHRLLHLGLDPRRETYPGMASRGLGLVLDCALAWLVFLVAAASLALVASLAGALRGGTLQWSVGGGALLAVAAAYFAGFWSTTGQTPGMRMLRVRVVTHDGKVPSLLRSLVRFAGLLLAIVPLFAGFLPALVDGRRRALQDFVAHTVVVHDDAAPPAP